MSDTVYQIVAEAQAIRARLAWLEQHGVTEHEREPLRRAQADVREAALALERLAAGYPPHPYARAETDAEALARIMAETKWDGHHYFGCRNPLAALQEGDAERLRGMDDPQAAALARALGVMQSGATLPKDPSPGAIRAAEACGAAEDGRVGSLPQAFPGAPPGTPRFCAACRRPSDDDLCDLCAGYEAQRVKEGRR